MKFKKLIATLLIVSQAAFAASTPDSSYSVGSKITAGDRSVVFQSGSSKSVIKRNDSTGKLQFAHDGSTFSDMGSGSGGGGGVNFIGQTTSWAATNQDDINLDTSIGNWTAFADAAASIPVDLTGGSPTVTCTRSTSNPLNGAASLLITKDASNRQGEGCSVPFNVQPSYQGKTVTITFPVQVTSGSFVGGDIQVFVYNVTKSVLITPTNLNVTPTGVTATFPTTAIDSTPVNHAYRFGIYFATTSATAATLKADDFSIAPYQAVFGPTTIPWTAYTPTGSWTTNTTYTGRYRVENGQMHVEVNIALSGAPNSVGLNSILIPSGWTIDTSKLASGSSLGQSLGSGHAHITNEYPLRVVYVSTTEFRPLREDYGGDGSGTDVVFGSINQSAPATWGSGNYMNLKASFPVVEAGTLQTSNSSQFRISTYLANGSRVTATPKALGEYRTYTKDSGALSATDNAPSVGPSVVDGMRIYGNVAFSSAGTSGQPGRWEMYVGIGKSVRFDFFSATGKVGRADVTYYTEGTYDAGLRYGYDSSTGVAWVDGIDANGSGTSRNAGVTIPVNGASRSNLASVYFDVTVSENALAVGIDQNQVISNQSNERIERASIQNNGTCTILSQSGSWLSVSSHPGTGQCTLAMTGFSAAPTCTCSGASSGACIIGTISSSSVRTVTRDVLSSGALADENVFLTCMGPK